jgi:hypothetical protein
MKDHHDDAVDPPSTDPEGPRPHLAAEGPPATIISGAVIEGGTDLLPDGCPFNGRKYRIGTEICVAGTAYLCQPTGQWQDNGSC